MNDTTTMPNTARESRAPSALELVRANCRAIPLYAPHGGPVEVDLTDNTNLWGTPPAAERVIREFSSVSRYPTTYAFELKEALAGYLGTTVDGVVTGCGSDQVLDCAIRAFAGAGDLLAHPNPSFVMVPLFARLNALETIGIPLSPEGDMDADRFVESGARVIFLCSPNNPTGGAAARAAIEHVVEHSRGLVIIDEAYAEFAAMTSVDLTTRSDRVLVVRTLSKAFGMAGLRVGYGAGAPDLVQQVERARGPYTVNSIAERAATAAVIEDEKWMRDHVAEAIAVREWLAAELREISLVPLRSDANFIFLPIDGACDIARRMLERGVAVRAFAGLPVYGDAMRITVGPRPMMERALEALKEAIA